MQTTILAGMSGTLLWTRTYRFIGMDPADIEKEEPRTEFSPMGPVCGACLWGLSMGAESCLYRKRVEDGISPTDNMKTQTLAFPRRRGLLSRFIQKSTAAQAHPRGRGLYTHAERPARDPGQSRRLVRLPTSKFNKLEARKIEQREGLQLLTAGLQYVNRIVNIVLSRFIRE